MKQIEKLLKNFLLRLLILYSIIFKRRDEQTQNKHSKILFIRLNRIGDALVSTPLLHLLKQNLNAKIYVLADQKNYFVFSNNPDVDKLIVFQKGVNGIRKIIKFIKDEKINTVVDLHDDVSATASFLIALSRVKNKFGLEKENKIIYTKTVKRLDPKTNHVITRIMELSKLFQLNPDVSDCKIVYCLNSESLSEAEKFLNKSLQAHRFTVGINISAGSEARFWGVERFKMLLELLVNYKQVNVLILSAPKDVKLANEVIKKVYVNVPVYSSEDFDKFAAVISKLNLLFTPDSAAVHLAAAFKIPVFGIYVHDTEDMVWSPWGVDFDYVSTKESNLLNVNFNEVKNKIVPFLEKQIKKFNTDE